MISTLSNILGIETNPVSHTERLVSALGSLLVIASIFFITRAALDTTATREQQLDGVLQLLRLPALYGEQQPELAAAALYHAMAACGRFQDSQGQAALRRELLSRYQQTYHATIVRQALSRKSDT